MALTRAIPVWMALDGTTRLALLDFGTLYHRGNGAPLPVRLYNSLGHPDAPAMSAVQLAARGHDAYAQSLLNADAVQVWQDGWSSLASLVALPDIASNASVDLWFQLRLPVEAEAAPETGRILIELMLTWE